VQFHRRCLTMKMHNHWQFSYVRSWKKRSAIKETSPTLPVKPLWEPEKASKKRTDRFQFLITATANHTIT